MFRRTGVMVALVATAGLALASVASAETGGKPVNFHLYRSTILSNTRVYNPAGEDLGKITDFVVSGKDGGIIYAALSYGGVAGVGTKYFAVPWDALALHEKDKTMYYVLNMEKAKLDNATGFKSDDWPTEPDRSFSAAPKAGEDKGEEAARKAKEGAKDALKDAKDAVIGKGDVFRTSGIIGTAVKNENNEDLGKISDIVFDVKKAKPAYMVLSHGGVAGVGAKLFAAGWDCFKLDSANLKPGQRVFVCAIDKATLESNPGFGDNWPHEPDARFAKKPAK